MFKARHTIIAAALFTVGAAAFAADDAAAVDHSTHHAAPDVTSTSTQDGASKQYRMREMMLKLNAAKTPGERKALMAERKAEMASDNAAKGLSKSNETGHAGMHCDMMAKHQSMENNHQLHQAAPEAHMGMEKRMDALESMMKEMLGRLPAAK